MKKNIFIYLLSAFFFSDISIAGSVEEVYMLKKENQSLKEELQSLRDQLKLNAPAMGDDSNKSIEKSDTHGSGNVLEIATQTQGVTKNFSKNLQLSLGSKLWVNRWGKFFPDAYNTAVYTVDSEDTALTPIPTASIKYKNLFLSGSYFSQTDYQWKSTGIAPIGGPLPAGSVLKLNIDGSRREFDVTAGYFVHPNIAISAGYKDILQEFNTTGTIDGIPGTPYKGTNSVTYKGPILGLLGVVPIGNGFGLYGNFAYGWMNLDAGGYAGIHERDASYVLADGGFSYSYSLKALTSLPISANAFAGYRYQALDVENVGARSQKAADYTKGFVTGLNISF